MAVLMKDVAEKAGISLSTASQVLSGSTKLAISKETRRRVLDIAKELNYRPNRNAQLLAQRAGDTFGLVISEIANPFFPEIIQSFESAAAARGFEIVLCNTEYDERRARAAVEKLLNNKVRGVAVVTSQFEPALIEHLTAQGVPIVSLNAAPAPGVSTIEVDFAEGLHAAVEHLKKLGHRHFAAITGPADVTSAERYAVTLRRVMEERGAILQRVLECNYRLEGGMEAIRTLLSETSFPTAILCGNDLIALGAISVLEQVGRSVPEDVSIVGFDDIVYARLSRPPLTTVAVPRAELGRAAFDTLYRMQRGKRKRSEAVTLGTELVIRKSTAPPRVHAKRSRSVSAKLI
jgi:LacI family transcriptional regulator